MAYDYSEARRALQSSIAPADSPADSASYRARVLEMFARAQIRVAAVALTDAQLAADPGRWILAYADNVDEMQLHLIAIPAELVESWRADLARATYLAPDDAPNASCVRLAGALGHAIEQRDLDDFAGDPGCPTLATIAADASTFRGLESATVDADGVAAGGILDGRILGVTCFIAYQ